MRKNNRTCIICGRAYRYCNTCAEHTHLPTWMNIYHDENCRQIATILRMFASGEYSVDVAKALLLDCDLSVADQQKNSFKAAYEQIFPVAEPETTSEEIIEDENEDKVIAEEIKAVNEEKKFEKNDTSTPPRVKEVNFKKHEKKHK